MIPLPPRGRSRRPALALPAKVLVADAMTPDPVVIPKSADIEQAARLLVTRRIGCLPVVERGRLAGSVLCSGRDGPRGA